MEVLQEDGIERELLKTLKVWKKKWLGHVLSGDSLYRTVMEGKRESLRGARASQMSNVGVEGGVKDHIEN